MGRGVNLQLLAVVMVVVVVVGRRVLGTIQASHLRCRCSCRHGCGIHRMPRQHAAPSTGAWERRVHPVWRRRP
jgi:hypothetical protein